jgi:hypothetical protein
LNPLNIRQPPPRDHQASSSSGYALTSENEQQVACGGALHFGNTFEKISHLQFPPSYVHIVTRKITAVAWLAVRATWRLGS